MGCPYVFISYSSRNIKEAETVLEVFNEKGISCWMAPDSIPVGSNYSTEIFDAISDCSAFLLILSKESMDSDYVSKELDLAVSNRKYILPVSIDGEQQTPSFRFYLCNVQVIPIDDSIRHTAKKMADLILHHNTSSPVRRILLAQKFEKPAVSILPDNEAIEQLDRLFELNNIVCISGMGGMGKSELAKLYIKSLMDQNAIDIVSYNTCTGSIKQTVSMIPFEGIDDEDIIEESKAAKSQDDVVSVLYKKKLAFLKSMDERTILVFDGLSKLDYEGMKVLNNLKCKVLVTTRYHFDEYPELQIEKFMTPDKQKALFLRYYEDFSGSDEDMMYIEKIIEAVGYHVLTLSLIASYLNTTGMLPGELYRKMFHNGSIVLTTSEKVSYMHNYRTIDEHITNLFQMSDLSPEELRILQQLSYIPVHGIAKRQFRFWTEPGTMSYVEQLILKGWVQNNKGIITLHPIIHSIMEKKRPERLEMLAGFFQAIIRYLDRDSIDSIAQRQYAALLCEYLFYEIKETSLLACQLFLALGRYLNDYTYWLLFGARNTYRFTYFTQAQNKGGKYMKQFSIAEACLNKAKEICKASGIGNQDGIRSRIYSNLGCTYYNMTRFQDAKTFHQIALEMRTEELGPSDIHTMTSRRRLGTTCLELSDEETALACYHKNLELLLETKGDAFEISKAYYDCGKVYIKKGDYEKALEYLRCAVQELKTADSAQIDVLGAAQLYYVTAMTISAMNKVSYSEERKEEALGLLREAEQFTDTLDSALSDELKEFIQELERLFLE